MPCFATQAGDLILEQQFLSFHLGNREVIRSGSSLFFLDLLG